MRQLKNRSGCDPQAKYAIGGRKWLSPHISTVCPLQDPRETHLRSCRTNHRTITPAGTGGLSTREVDHTLGHLADATCKTLRIDLRLRRRGLCLSISQQPATLYDIAASPPSYCDCYLTGTCSAWSWSWLVIAASPFPAVTTNGAGHDASRTTSYSDPSWHPFLSTCTPVLTCQPPYPESMHTPTIQQSCMLMETGDSMWSAQQRHGDKT